jgi:hypothetical protein
MPQNLICSKTQYSEIFKMLKGGKGMPDPTA